TNFQHFTLNLDRLIEKHTGDGALPSEHPHPIPPTVNHNSNRRPVPQANPTITQNDQAFFKDILVIFASNNQSHTSFQNPGRQCVTMGIAFLFWMDQHGSSQSLTSDKLDDVMVQGDQLDVITRASKPLPPFISVNHLPNRAVLFGT